MATAISGAARRERQRGGATFRARPLPGSTGPVDWSRMRLGWAVTTDHLVARTQAA